MTAKTIACFRVGHGSSFARARPWLIWINDKSFDSVIVKFPQHFAV